MARRTMFGPPDGAHFARRAALRVAAARRMWDEHPLIQPAAVAIAAGVAVTVVATVDPNEPGHYPRCPLLATTGLFCPGCGSLRALHALAHAQVGLAVDRNLLTVAAVPILALTWVLWTLRRSRRRARRGLAPPALLWGLAGLVVAFGVLRNLPAGAWLAP